MFKAMQERSTMSKEQWASKTRINEGDWLTLNNTRAAKCDRANDIDSMEWLDYVVELSAPWHFALNATHLIMRSHLGNGIIDPTGLAAHKGMLHRICMSINRTMQKPNHLFGIHSLHGYCTVSCKLILIPNLKIHCSLVKQGDSALKKLVRFAAMAPNFG